MNLDFGKVCGKHNAIYEAYYKQIDPKSSGAIEAMTAAKFLKKSGLSDVVLSRIWDLSDPNGKGFLDKPGFFVALKLVSLAQAGQVINMTNIYMDTANPPKVGDLPKIQPQRIQAGPLASASGGGAGDWSIKIIDRLKYEQLFESLKPVGGMLPGNKVKGVLMDSKLPMEMLGKIWDLADQDKDGNLDKHEFIVAMHLVYQTLQKRTIPDVLPPELRKTVGAGQPPPPKPAPPAGIAMPAVSMPRAPSGEGFNDTTSFVANFPKDIAPPAPAIPSLSTAIPGNMQQRVPTVTSPLISTDPLIPIGAPPSVVASADWVVTAAELKRYETIFRDSDRDKDGLVSGLEVKNVFLQSGVPQNCLAHIWALCDTNQSGKLTLEQFALAMWMVERKQKGTEPPQVLTSNMVPPSMRAIIAGVDLQPQEPKPTYSNPELEMISKEIEELAKERRALETENAQKEADIRIKSGEVRSLQSELDTLSATLKQLENQRGEAQKRLDDLKSQVSKIREQCQKQEDTINEQEGELNTKRSEMQKLKDEEAALQKEYDANNKELLSLTTHLQNTQLQISSIRSMVTQLLETQRQMTDALLMCRAAIENNDSELVSEYQLKIEPDFDDARKTVEKKIEITNSDPFKDANNGIHGNDASKENNSFATNGFASDPFAANANTTTTQRSASGFDDSFNNSGFDAFGNSTAVGGFEQQKDPFGSDAFGANKSNAITPEPGKDDFGSDPFAALHAPTGKGQVLSPNVQKSGPPPRPESPSPALPPKKSKVPPPRPAPPRPLQAPARPTQPAMDAFGGTAHSGGGFADFADFDNKQQSIIINQIPSQTRQHIPQTIDNSSINTLHLNTSTSTSTSILSPNTTLNSGNRSKTPEPKSATVTSIISSKSATSPVSSPTAIYGPTDFADDPFKDYRYEDPFNIKDPFSDDDNFQMNENAFRDDLSSDDLDDDNNNNDADQQRKEEVYLSQVNTSNTSNSTCTTSQTFNSAKSNTPLSFEFLEQLDAVRINSSPAHSAKTINGSGDGASTAAATTITPTTTTITTTNTITQNVKSQRNTPIFGGIVNNFDNFADFDTFSSKSSTKSSNNNSATDIPASMVATTLQNNNNNKRNNTQTSSLERTKIDISKNDSFFDAFNDHFLYNNKSTANKKTSNTQHTTLLDAFDIKDNNNKGTTTTTKAMLDDAFGGGILPPATEIISDGFDSAFVVTKSSKIFDDDDDFSVNTFEDNFFKSTAATATTTTIDRNCNAISLNAKCSKSVDDFAAKFEIFDNNDMTLNNSIGSEGAAFDIATGSDKLVKVQNNIKRISPNNVVTDKLPPKKFAADYSSSDTFQHDMEEVIKRSLLEN